MTLRLLAVTASLALAMGLGTQTARAAGSLPKHVMVIFFENESEDTILSLPFFARFASQGATLMNFHAETHPSQPNYIGLISGDLHGVTDDNNVNIDAQHLGDLLEAKGKRWKVYAEALPNTPCYQGETISTYWRKHEPFISFKNVQTNPARCANIVNANALDADIAAGNLPEFSLYIPDINNNGHDTNAKYADNYFRTKFGPLLKDPRFMKDMLLVATFDESIDQDPSNQIYTVLYGDRVVAGSKSQVYYNHYSLLRMVEDIFGLQTLGTSDKSAAPITDIWKR